MGWVLLQKYNAIYSTLSIGRSVTVMVMGEVWCFKHLCLIKCDITVSTNTSKTTSDYTLFCTDNKPHIFVAKA